MEKKVGFWEGVGMVWTALIMACVLGAEFVRTCFSALLKLAQSGDTAAEVAHNEVKTWAMSPELQKKLDQV